MRYFALSVGAAAVALATACTQTTPAAPATPAVDPAAIATAIRAVETQWNADWAARDAAKIASHYATDATLIVAGSASMTGRDAIQAGLAAGPLADHNFSLTFHADDVQVAEAGDMAFTRGAYEEHDTNARTHRVVTTNGAYLTVYRKQADGSWLAVADMAAPGGPPMAPAAAATPAAATPAAH